MYFKSHITGGLHDGKFFRTGLSRPKMKLPQSSPNTYAVSTRTRTYLTLVSRNYFARNP